MSLVWRKLRILPCKNWILEIWPAQTFWNYETLSLNWGWLSPSLASVFFFLFRKAYKSVSNLQKFLISILFYYLSIFYQLVNMVSTVFILSTMSDLLDREFYLLLFNARQWLLIAILATLCYISLLSHFWMDKYLQINHSYFTLPCIYF